MKEFDIICHQVRYTRCGIKSCCYVMEVAYENFPEILIIEDGTLKIKKYNGSFDDLSIHLAGEVNSAEWITVPYFLKKYREVVSHIREVLDIDIALDDITMSGYYSRGLTVDGEIMYRYYSESMVNSGPFKYRHDKLKVLKVNDNGIYSRTILPPQYSAARCKESNFNAYNVVLNDLNDWVIGMCSYVIDLANSNRIKEISPNLPNRDYSNYISVYSSYNGEYANGYSFNKSHLRFETWNENDFPKEYNRGTKEAKQAYAKCLDVFEKKIMAVIEDVDEYTIYTNHWTPNEVVYLCSESTKISITINKNNDIVEIKVEPNWKKTSVIKLEKLYDFRKYLYKERIKELIYGVKTLIEFENFV